MKITGFMRNMHNPRYIKNHTKRAISLLLAVSIMLTTLCIVAFNAIATVAPIENALIDTINMNLFNYGNMINRYMRNTDSSWGSYGTYRYNSEGLVNTNGGGYLPFVDGESGTGGSVDHWGNEASSFHTYPSMSTILDANGMPVINEQGTSVLYNPNGVMSTLASGSGVPNGGVSVSNTPKDSSDFYTYAPITYDANNVTGTGVTATKQGFYVRTPMLRNIDLHGNESDYTVSFWLKLDKSATFDKNVLCFQFYTKGFLTKENVKLTNGTVSDEDTTKTEYNNLAEQWAYRYLFANVSFVSGEWKYFSLSLKSDFFVANSDSAAYDAYTALDTIKAIEAFSLHENETKNNNHDYKFTVAGVKLTGKDIGTIDLIDNTTASTCFYGNNSGTNIGDYINTVGDVANISVGSAVELKDTATTYYDAYYCDYVDKYTTYYSPSWYTPQTGKTGFNSSVSEDDRKRGITITTSQTVPYINDYLSKYSIEMDIYLKDTYFADQGLSHDLMFSIVPESMVRFDSQSNYCVANNFVYRYRFNELAKAGYISQLKCGWNHVVIPLTATNNKAGADILELINTEAIGAISFYDNAAWNQSTNSNGNVADNEDLGTYDLGIGNIRIVKNNGTGIYPTYYSLVTVNDFGSNTTQSNYKSTITNPEDNVKKTDASYTVNDVVYCTTTVSTTNNVDSDGNPNYGTARKQGVYITTNNDDTDYRYLYDTAPESASGYTTEYFISAWIYLEPKNGDWSSTPQNDLYVCLIPEGMLNLRSYAVDSSGNVSVSKESGMVSYAEHYFYRQSLGNNLKWGWNHCIVDITKKNFQTEKNTDGTWKNELVPAIRAFNENGRIDAVAIHEMTSTNVTTYDFAVGEVSIFNINESGSLGYLFDPSATSHTSESDYLAGMADRLTASGDADEYEGGPYWHNEYDDAVYNYQSAYFEVDKSTSGLFQYDKATGTYYYKSNHNAATYNFDTNRFDLYDYTINRSNRGYDYYTEGEDAGYPKNSFANFYPFNIGHDQGVLNYSNEHVSTETFAVNGQVGAANIIAEYDSTKPDGVIPDNYSLKQDSKENEVDLSFGFSFNFDFYMPKDGITSEGNEMIFSFTGDDDIWVYIDGILFLDIGGAHPPRTGTINFATGVITYQNLDVVSNTPAENDYFAVTTIKAQLEKALNELSAAGLTNTENYTKISNLIANLVEVEYVDEEGNTQVGYTFDNYSMHELDFFYLERGGSESCCKIEFNLEPLPEQSVSVTKTVAGMNDAVDEELLFSFRILDENGEGVESWPFDICYKGTTNSITGASYATSANGEFQIPGGTTAVFKDIPYDTKFTITEVLDTGQYYTVANNVQNSASTGQITMPDTPVYIEFTNTPRDELKFLQITKTVNGTEPEEGIEYTAVVTFDVADDGYTLYNGPATRIDVNGNETQITVTDGVIKLKNGESAVINGIPVDAKYQIKELAPNSFEGYEYLNPYIAQTEYAFDTFHSGVIKATDGNNYISINNTVRETYGDLMITKNGIEDIDHHADATPENTEDLGKEEQQTTLFNIKGTTELSNHIDFDVAITGNDYVIVRDLPVGSYTVTEKTDWSWRYDPDVQSQTVEIAASDSLSSEMLVDADNTASPVEGVDYGSTLSDTVENMGTVNYTTVAGEDAYSFVYETSTETTTRKDGIYIATDDEHMHLVGYENNYIVKARVYISDITNYYILFQIIPSDYLKLPPDSDQTNRNYVEYWAYRFILTNETATLLNNANSAQLQVGWNELEIPLSVFKTGLDENAGYTTEAYNSFGQVHTIGAVTFHENAVENYTPGYTFAVSSVEIVSSIAEVDFQNERENIYYLSGDNVMVNTFDQTTN